VAIATSVGRPGAHAPPVNQAWLDKQATQPCHINSQPIPIPVKDVLGWQMYQNPLLCEPLIDK